MLNFPICYLFCYDCSDYDDALSRLFISISSLPEYSDVIILTWHKDLKSKLHALANGMRRLITYVNIQPFKFSRSTCINILADYLVKNNYKEYFYLSDTDLIFHPLYFLSLANMFKILQGSNSDIRIVTFNYNVYPLPKFGPMPNRIIPRLSRCLPSLFDWSPPNCYTEVLSRRLSPAGYAHGCGLFPIGSLQHIGGFNAEMVGHGPEDDLLNQRLRFFSRIYYHKSRFTSSSFHMPHKPLHQQNSKVNHSYWKMLTNELNYHGLYAGSLIRTD